MQRQHLNMGFILLELSRWTTEFIKKAHIVFKKDDKREKQLEKELAKAYKKIGELEKEEIYRILPMVQDA